MLQGSQVLPGLGLTKVQGQNGFQCCCRSRPIMSFLEQDMAQEDVWCQGLAVSFKDRFQQGTGCRELPTRELPAGLQHLPLPVRSGFFPQPRQRTFQLGPAACIQVQLGQSKPGRKKSKLLGQYPVPLLLRFGQSSLAQVEQRQVVPRLVAAQCWIEAGEVLAFAVLQQT